MAKVTNVPQTRRRHKKYLKAAKGFFGGRGRLYRAAREAVKRSWAYATKHRRRKKRDFRQLWNVRVSAGARSFGVSYSVLMAGLRKAHVTLNRKMLADIARDDSDTFRELVELAKSHA